MKQMKFKEVIITANKYLKDAKLAFNKKNQAFLVHPVVNPREFGFLLSLDKLYDTSITLKATKRIMGNGVSFMGVNVFMRFEGVTYLLTKFDFLDDSEKYAQLLESKTYMSPEAIVKIICEASMNLGEL